MTLTPELLDEHKYREYGAYHWKVYTENELYAKYVDKLISLILKGVPKNWSIIDIGCGDGLFTSILKNKGYQKIQGIDANKKAIDICQAMGIFWTKNLNLYDLANPYRVALLLDVFEHLEQPKKAIEILSKYVSKRIYLVFPIEKEKSKHHVEMYNAKKVIKLFAEKDWKTVYRGDFVSLNKILLTMDR